MVLIDRANFLSSPRPSDSKYYKNSAALTSRPSKSSLLSAVSAAVWDFLLRLLSMAAVAENLRVRSY
eukprot:COSAG01_NODE_367_length_18064_cov_23.990315_12_plen_67_part_00